MGSNRIQTQHIEEIELYPKEIATQGVFPIRHHDHRFCHPTTTIHYICSIQLYSQVSITFKLYRSMHSCVSCQSNCESSQGNTCLLYLCDHMCLYAPYQVPDVVNMNYLSCYFMGSYNMFLYIHYIVPTFLPQNTYRFSDQLQQLSNGKCLSTQEERGLHSSGAILLGGCDPSILTLCYL